MQNAWFILVLAMGAVFLLAAYKAAHWTADRAEKRRATTSGPRVTPEEVRAAGSGPFIDVTTGERVTEDA